MQASPNAPKAIGPYSQAIKVNGVVYVSGCLGLDPKVCATAHLTCLSSILSFVHLTDPMGPTNSIHIDKCDFPTLTFPIRSNSASMQPVKPLSQTGEFAGADVKAQTHMVFRNMAAVLKEAGCGMNDVVKSTVLLADMADFAAVNEIYAQNFSQPYPARSTFAVKTLPKNAYALNW